MPREDQEAREFWAQFDAEERWVRDGEELREDEDGEQEADHDG